MSSRVKWRFHPSIIELRCWGSYWGLLVTQGTCGKELRHWRKVKVVKVGVLRFLQKVFDHGLIKQMKFNWHGT